MATIGSSTSTVRHPTLVRPKLTLKREASSSGVTRKQNKNSGLYEKNRSHSLCLAFHPGARLRRASCRRHSFGVHGGRYRGDLAHVFGIPWYLRAPCGQGTGRRKRVYAP